jgi:molybdate transport system substrate-binding protein
MSSIKALKGLSFGIWSCAILVWPHASYATELRLLSSLGLKPVVDAVVPEFERETGHKVVVRFALTPQIPQTATENPGFDVAISDPKHIANMITQGTVRPGTATNIARFGMGVGVRAGVMKPDVGTPAALKSAAFKFGSIGYVAVGSTGPVVRAMLGKLGIAEEMQPKLKAGGVAESLDAVASGTIDAVLMPVPLITAAKGVQLAGAWPKELQDYIVMTGGVSSASPTKAEAAALLQFFMSSKAESIVVSKGYERVD